MTAVTEIRGAIMRQICDTFMKNLPHQPVPVVINYDSAATIFCFGRRASIIAGRITTAGTLMRIIHTADWHLGQFFYNKSRAAEHQAFLDWLLIQIEQHQVDALIVAGDLFDTGTPPSYAREMFNRFVVALQPSGCQLIVLAGNHDSVATLNESRELLACLNTRVIATPQAESDVIVLTTRQGEPGVRLCAIPYLRPRDILRSRAGQSGRDKQTSLLEAIAHHYQHRVAAARALEPTLPMDSLSPRLNRSVPLSNVVDHNLMIVSIRRTPLASSLTTTSQLLSLVPSEDSSLDHLARLLCTVGHSKPKVNVVY